MGVGANKEPKKTEKEILRENKRVVDRASRKMEREIANIGRLEEKTLREVAALAKKGQHGPAKTMAKTVAGCRKQRDQFYTMSANLKAISMQMSAASITKEMMGTMSSVNGVVSKMNEELDAGSI